MEIKSQKVPKKKVSVDDILATFCYYFPQYTFLQAEKVPYKRVIQMIKVAKRLEAQNMMGLTHIAAAPHTKKGQGVKKLLEYYKGVIEENG